MWKTASTYVSVRFPLNFRHDPEALGNLTLNALAESGSSQPGCQKSPSAMTKGTIRVTPAGALTVRIDLQDRDLVFLISTRSKQIAESVLRSIQVSTRICRGSLKTRNAPEGVLLVLVLVLGAMLLSSIPSLERCVRRCVLGVVPLANLGGLIALFVTGETLNIATAVGFIAYSASPCRTGSSWSRTSPGSRDRRATA